MIKVDVLHSDPKKNYPINSVKLTSAVKTFLEVQKKDNVQLVVVVTGRKEMKRLAKLYLKERGKPAHNVLSFTESEVRGNFMYPPGKYIRLGEIIICYPVALAESKEMGIPVENRIVDLAVHGTEHLLGKHHD